MAPMWPKEYGGAAWTPIQRLIFDQEAQRRVGARSGCAGIFMLGPILIAFGSDETEGELFFRAPER